MSDIFKKRDLSGEEFTRQFKKEIQKEAGFKFNFAGMQKLREDYGESYNSANQFKEKLQDNLGIGDITIDQSMTIEELEEKGDLRSEEQRVLVSDMKKKATHSGKQSKQEKAANERNEFNIWYNQDAAKSVLNAYKAKAQEIKDGQAEVKEYTCTGQEFILPLGAEDAQEGPASNIVKVMLERDRLTNMIKSTPVGKSPYAKAKRACDEKLLAYMNDMIDTYMKANKVDQKTGGEPKEKEVKAAKEHMALAMEKYEMFARNYEENIGELMQSSIKKSEVYKTNLATNTQERKTKAEENENDLITLISNNKSRIGNKGANVKKVYAAFEKLNAKYAELAAASSAMFNYQERLNDKDEKRIVQKLVDKQEEDINAVEFAKKACEAYIKSIVNGKPMKLMDAAYIQKHFGIDDASMSIGKERVLDMNKPILEQNWGLSEYDETFRNKMSTVMAEAKAELEKHSEEEINADLALRKKKDHVDKYYSGLKMGSFRNMVNAYQYVNPEFNRTKALLMDSVLSKKYNNNEPLKTHGGTRDVETMFLPLEGEAMNQDEYETTVVNYVKAIERVDLATNKEASVDEMHKAFNNIMPALRNLNKELADYRKKHKGFFNGQKDLEKITDIFTDYEMLFYLGSKGQAIKNTVERIAGNEELVNLLSEEEKTELLEMALEGTVWMRYSAVAASVDKVYRSTPNEVLNNNVMLIGKGYDYENSYKEGYKNSKKIIAGLKFKVQPSDVPKVKMGEGE